VSSAEEVIDNLRSKAKPDNLAGMAKYGMAVEQRLGVSVPDMRKIAKELGRDHNLALELWQTGAIWSKTPLVVVMSS